MTERIKIEVDDEELEAVINRLDEAIIKKAKLVTETSIVTRTAPEISPVKDDMTATIERLKTELVDVENMAAVVEASVEGTVNRLTLEIISVEQSVAYMEREWLIRLLEAETRSKSLSERVRDLPNIDRATRMILLRIPGLREVLRLIYIVKMEERTLRLGQIVSTAKAAEIDVAATINKLTGGLAAVEVEAVAVELSVQATVNRLTAEIQAAEAQAATTLSSVRGPVTAGITLLMYALMANQQLQQRQDRIEAKMAALEREMNQRYITMEEAVRGQGELSERYRTNIPP